MNSYNITIHQHNVNHSRTIQRLLLQEMDPETNQIIALQEPWTNPQNRRTVSQGYYPIIPAHEHPRVAILISTQLDSTTWRPIYYDTGDLVTVEMQTNLGPIYIHNCYNPSGPTSHSQDGTLSAVEAALRGGRSQDNDCQQILLGDFNLHHPRWGANLAPTAHRMADKLLEITAEAGMQQVLEPGTVTWERQGSSCQTIDLVFATAQVEQNIISCRTEPDKTHGSDHLPVVTTVCNTAPAMKQRYPRPQWKKAEWDEVRQHLQTQLDQAQLHNNPLDTRAAIDEATKQIQEAIQTTVEATIPKARPSQYARESWTKESQNLIDLTRKRRREWKAARDDQSYRAFVQTSRARNKQIKTDTNLAWRKVVREITNDPSRIWRLAKWAREGANQAHQNPQFPDLQGPNNTREGTNEGKAEVLANHFFPPARTADLGDIPSTQYPSPFCMEKEVQEPEILQILHKLPVNKAPGPDQIPNLVLKECGTTLAPVLARLFTACLEAEYHPQAFKHSITVVLRKPQKPDYSKPGAYRPIALLNTLAKALEAVVARRMSKETEQRGLLPGAQMGARPGRSTSTALDLITEQVKTIWTSNPKAVASMLCLDISGAFDNVSHARLLHNLKLKGFPRYIIGFVQSFLQERTTCLRLGDFIDQARPQATGIPQGSTLSPILFLFFASTLLPALHEGKTTAMGFVDDSNILTYSNSTEENCRQLERAHQKCLKWASQHGAAFAPQKYQLIHFTRGRRHNLKATVQIQGFEEGPVPSLRLLGVWVDTKLQWGPHIKKAAEKGAQQMQSLQRLCKSTWGASFQKARHLYTAVVRPAITFGCTTWADPEGTQGHRKGLTQPLEKIQNQALRHITGAYKSVPAAVLQREADVPPIHLYTQDLARQSAAKNNDSQASRYIQERCREIARRAQRSRRTRQGRATPQMQTRQERIQEIVRTQEALQGPHQGALRKDWWLNQKWDSQWAKAKADRAQRSQGQPAAWTSDKANAGRHLHKGWTRPESTMATLLRTEHIGLRAYLAKRRVPGISPDCDCGQGYQTPKHICIQCPERQERRTALFEAAGTSNWKDLTGTKRGLLATARWMIQQGALEQFSLAQREEAQRIREEEEG